METLSSRYLINEVKCIFNFNVTPLISRLEKFDRENFKGHDQWRNNFNSNS